jgi:hypothetical protein
MAFSTSGVFGALIEDTLENTTAMDLNADSFKVALYNNTGTPDVDDPSADTAYAAAGSPWVVANEVDDTTNWDTGGEPLVTPTSTRATGVYTFDGVDTVQGGANTTLASVYGCLVYDDTITTPVADQGLCFNDFGGVQSVTSGDFTIQWHTNGIFTITFTAA